MTDETTPTAGAAASVTPARSSLNQTGRLPVGLVIDGVRHQDFEMRPPTIADQVDASLETATDSGLELQTAVFSRQLVRLGTLPADKIDFSLLMNINPLDWNALNAADDEIRKKVLREGQELSGGPTFAPSSSATA